MSESIDEEMTMSQPPEPRKPTPEASQPDSALDEAIPGGSYNVDPDTADKAGVEQETLEDKDSVPAPEGEGTERE
ncbi:hypothetical protein [Pseudomonas indica]|uniref:hypothetical protein n=2 Tax=Pseudomonas indica TaxID=137658 RepID=UPI0011410E6F|nr:hypothetical protein [Pseudomonas indica]